MSKPRLVIDLKGTDGNIYVVIGKARQIVPADQLDAFINAILDAQRPGANKTYEGMLAIINSYADLVDSSGTYPEYAGGQPMDERAIIAAVDKLNEGLKTLPDNVPCSIEDLYPDFDIPECGPEMYLALLEGEALEVKAKIDQADEGQREPLQRLLAMLGECAAALHLAGVTLDSDGDQEETATLNLTGDVETCTDQAESSELP